MSNYQPKDNSGAIFRNEKKESASHSDYAGQAMIGRQMYWVSAWVKQAKNGKKFMSLSFKLQEGKTDNGNKKSGSGRRQPEPDDEILF